MASSSNNAHKRQSSGGMFDISAQVVKFPVKVVTFTFRKLDWRVASFILIVSVVFASGWAGARVMASSKGQITASPPSSAQEAGLVGGTPIGVSVPDVGVLDGVSITGTWIKAPPGSENQEYMVSVTFPTPPQADCDDSCSQAMKYLLGSDSCDGQVCIAELKDVDEGGKVNSSDLYALCQYYENTKSKVLIEFSGRRDQTKSDYADILLVTPLAQ
jgi:hypothetical protein